MPAAALHHAGVQAAQLEELEQLLLEDVTDEVCGGKRWRFVWRAEGRGQCGAAGGVGAAAAGGCDGRGACVCLCACVRACMRRVEVWLWVWVVGCGRGWVRSRGAGALNCLWRCALGKRNDSMERFGSVGFHGCRRVEEHADARLSYKWAEQALPNLRTQPPHTHLPTHMPFHPPDKRRRARNMRQRLGCCLCVAKWGGRLLLHEEQQPKVETEKGGQQLLSLLSTLAFLDAITSISSAAKSQSLQRAPLARPGPG
eukprot:365156-Chlamydomonas_euryale.AAC.3